MKSIKSLLVSTALLLALPQVAQADILVGFVTGLSGPVSSIGTALREALFATKELVGTQGVYTYTPADRHDVDDRSRILVQIEDGKYKLLP